MTRIIALHHRLRPLVSLLPTHLITEDITLRRRRRRGSWRGRHHLNTPIRRRERIISKPNLDIGRSLATALADAVASATGREHALSAAVPPHEPGDAAQGKHAKDYGENDTKHVGSAASLVVVVVVVLWPVDDADLGSRVTGGDGAVGLRESEEDLDGEGFVGGHVVANRCPGEVALGCGEHLGREAVTWIDGVRDAVVTLDLDHCVGQGEEAGVPCY